MKHGNIWVCGQPTGRWMEKRKNWLPVKLRINRDFVNRCKVIVDENPHRAKVWLKCVSSVKVINVCPHKCMQNIINFIWLGGLLYMKIGTGSFICLSEVLNLHVGLMDDRNPFRIYETADFVGKRANSNHFNVCETFWCLILSSYSFNSIPSSATAAHKTDPV